MNKSANRRNIVTASEISQYTYCPISWYLRRCGRTPESSGFERGINKHVEVGKRISLVQKQERSFRILRILEYLSLMVALGLMVWWLLRF